MQPIDRRQAILHLGVGTAGLLWLPRGAAASVDLSMTGLDELAARFRTAPHAEIFDHAAAALDAGADYATLLGAAFLAGVYDIQPRGVGGKLHAVMMVESAFQLAERASPREATLAALWAANDFKRSQTQDRDEGDWVLPPTPKTGFAGEPAARRELDTAMATRDAERADRAITGLLPHHGRAALFEILWPYAVASYVDIGHKIIFATQVERALRRIGWRWAEPAVRSLVQGLLYESDAISGSETAVYENGRRLARGFPTGWLAGREDETASEQLLAGLRDRDPAGAQELVAAAFADGLGPQTVWDGLRLYATELYHRRPAAAVRRAAPVHPVTEVNAFGHVFRTTRNDATRRLAVLQAAGWLPLLRRDLIGFLGPLEGSGIDLLGAAAGERPADLDRIFATASPADACARLEREPRIRREFLTRMRGLLFRRATRNHQYKYAAAVEEEAALAAPRFAPRILAPAITYLPNGTDPDSEIFKRSIHALGL